MARLKPDKLFVTFGEGVSRTEPICVRRYTLTHSDVTAELFLKIAEDYAYNEITEKRDEVLAEWCAINNQTSLCVYLFVDGEFGVGSADIRNTIFRRELPLALEAIRYGDNEFFNAHPDLDYAAIIVYFQSSIPFFNRVENWGMPINYKI